MSTKQIEILAILICYMLVNVGVGIWSSRSSARKQGGSFLDEYFAGGRSMGGLVLAMTLVATYTSASSFLGGPGLAASFGLTQSWIAAIQIGTAFLTLGVLGKKLGMIARRIDAVTISDYLRARYQSAAVVIVCSVAMVVFFITQMIAQFIGGATLLQTVTGVPYWAALLIFAAVVILYTAVGGFRAVVLTDTVQGIIMTIGTFLLIFFVIRAGGGFSHLVEKTSQMNPGWDLIGKGKYGKDVIALQPGYGISFWILVGLAVIGLPQTAVRSMSFKDTKSMHRAMIYGTVVVGILMIGMHFIGAFTGPLISNGAVKSTDAVIPYIVLHYLPTWAGGLFLAAPLAAVMSTVDSLLILASATLIKDIYVNYIRKEKKEAEEISNSVEQEIAEAKAASMTKKVKNYSFLTTAVLGVIVFLLALNPPSILVWINLFAMGGLETTFFWPLVGGLYWKKGNAKCCIASILIGLAVFLFFNQVKIAPFHIHEIVFGLIAGGLAYFITGKITNTEPSPEVLRNCF
ncbi:MAG: sodium/pantothenate symporter [Eubacteriales bacterium]|nr:sodium/pantothenate symporter [Eubacteriales bacterium]